MNNVICKNIQLINSPLDNCYVPGIRNGSFPPLNIASLNAFIKANLPKIETTILDGEYLTEKEICSKINAEIVGISCNSLSYNSALKIAKSAKLIGAVTILGGAHPSFLGKQIIKQRKEIDYAIAGDGETALLGILTGKPNKEISNLIFRECENIVINRTINNAITELPIPDYTGIDLNNYFERYRKIYYDKPFTKAFASYSSQGCEWRNNTKGGCIFCAIQHKGLRIKGAKEYWNELIQQQKIYGADFFWDVSDTFTSQRDWILQFAKEKPNNINFNLQVYGRATDIDFQMVEALKRIGVYEIFLGLESGSNYILNNTNKGTSRKKNLKAIKLLAKEDIKSVISIVLGLPGENFETIKETEAMIVEILDITSLSEINISLVLPLPGSRMMEMLKQKDLVNKESDIFDAKIYRETWFNNFTYLKYDELIDIQKNLAKYNKRIGTFGLTYSESNGIQQIIH